MNCMKSIGKDGFLGAFVLDKEHHSDVIDFEINSKNNSAYQEKI